MPPRSGRVRHPTTAASCGRCRRDDRRPWRRRRRVRHRYGPCRAVPTSTATNPTPRHAATFVALHAASSARRVRSDPPPVPPTPPRRARSHGEPGRVRSPRRTPSIVRTPGTPPPLHPRRGRPGPAAPTAPRVPATTYHHHDKGVSHSSPGPDSEGSSPRGVPGRTGAGRRGQRSRRNVQRPASSSVRSMRIVGTPGSA